MGYLPPETRVVGRARSELNLKDKSLPACSILDWQAQFTGYARKAQRSMHMVAPNTDTWSSIKFRVLLALTALYTLKDLIKEKENQKASSRQCIYL